MADETLNLLRAILIDQALASGNQDAFLKLTGPDWEGFVVDSRSGRADSQDPLGFLAEDPHFWDLRLYDTMALHPYLNYRYRDTVNGISYMGEIRVPVGWSGSIEARFRPRPANGPCISPPEWFQGLLTAIVNTVHLQLAE